MISRCYAAIYQAARAVVLHYKRYDQEDSQRLFDPIKKSLGQDYAESLKKWRSIRNDVEYSPLLSEAVNAKGLEHYRREALDGASEFLERA